MNKTKPQAIFGWCESCGTRTGQRKFRELLDGACSECIRKNLVQKRATAKKNRKAPVAASAPPQVSLALKAHLEIIEVAILDALDIASELERQELEFRLRRALALVRGAAR